MAGIVLQKAPSKLIFRTLCGAWPNDCIERVKKPLRLYLYTFVQIEAKIKVL